MNADMRAAPCDQDTSVVAQLLADATYEEISLTTGLSRGKIWEIACRFGVRKNEARIQERKREREARQRTFLEAILDTTATADVLDFLDGIPDGSVDLILTSPPYNIGKQYGGGAGDAMAHVAYLGWLTQVLAECARVLADGGTIALELGRTRGPHGRLVPLMVHAWEILERLQLTPQNDITWVQGHGLVPKRRLAERTEHILVFSKGEQRVFNPTPARRPQKHPDKRAFKGPRRGELSSHPLGAHPTNVWAFGEVHSNHPEKTGHPCQFPEALALQAIQVYSMPGDLVLDPFSGSGTTNAAAIRSGRRFVGADLHYADTRARRLATLAPDAVSPLPGVDDRTLAVWQAEARRVEGGQGGEPGPRGRGAGSGRRTVRLRDRSAAA